MDGIPIPWQLKIVAKVVLSRIPADYKLWSKLRLFRHGAMDRPERAYDIFRKHFGRVNLRPGFTMLELGPGDSLASAVIAKVHGASRSYLVDAGAFANRDIQIYSALSQFLQGIGLVVPTFTDIEEVVSFSDLTYLTAGLASLKVIPSQSVDFIFSHAVLEHIPYKEFLATMSELRRIQRCDGVSSHSVDLKDHLGGALNNLRFSEKTWEGKVFSQSGFYTNRIRFSQMLKLFENAGFLTEILAINRWNTLPIGRNRMDREFRQLTDLDLCVQDFDVLLR